MVNAVYGFASTLLKVVADLRPTHWAIAFDRPTPTFRHELFEDYKAQRPATPEELKSQIEKVHRMVEAFRMPIFEIDGFEADDILGTLSRQADEQGVETIIFTGDNDMLQAVLPRVKALTPRRTFTDTVLYDEKAVEEKYGIRPRQIPDLKALVGDASDNIPGVPGIGQKTATRILQQYGSLERMYERIEDVVPAKLQAVLRQHRERAFRGKQLCTLVTDVPIKLDLSACQVSNYDRSEVARLFQELEFTALLSRLPQTQTDSRSSVEPDLTPAHRTALTCHVIDSRADLDQLVRELRPNCDFAVGVETTDEKGAMADIVGIALSPARGKAYYIPVGHQGLDQPRQLPVGEVVGGLRPVLEGDTIGKIAYDGKQVMSTMAGCGAGVENLHFDCLVAAHLLGEKALGLKALAFKKLGIELPTPDRSPGKGKRPISPALVRPDQIASYACANANIVWGLKERLSADLHRQELWQLFTEVEMALIPVLMTMERHGVLLDTGLLHQMSVELGNELRKLEKEIYGAVGHQFNINSPQQLGNVLFQELRLPLSRKTKTGYSTEASVIEALIGTHPVIELILKYRQLSKLKSTYVDALPVLVNPRTGRVHTTFNQTGTATGRLSSSDPNLQNIPIRGDVGNQIRKAIIAPSGCLLLSADYSQIDLRVLAHLSEDPVLIAAFAADEDIHTLTASKIFGVPNEKVTPQMRRNAKVVNFGIIYGMSDYGLEQATSFTRDEASRFIALYFEKYPRVREFLESTKEQVRKLGYVQTVLGRRRLIPEINASNRMVREGAERMAINAPVQGTSADIIKVAMINLHREMQACKLESKMLLQIHDDLLFEVPERELQVMKTMVSELMPGAVELRVPLKVDIKAGKNWAEMA